jgi:hypothetical protein
MVEHMKGGAVIDVAIPEVALKLRSNISWKPTLKIM